ncbi:hypothetical protein XENTR_v10001037 [Xenopus tropicalis]|nr:hypothetical protein XENTR_v10001037 [Xenopus tropicalis]
MGPAMLIVLCCCLVTVTPFTEEQLLRATNYIRQHLTGRINNQYAYIAVFTTAQCRELTDANLRDALRQENADDLMTTIEQHRIYIGTQIVAASFLRLNNGGAMHAEARLLNGEGEAPSPVADLLNRNQDKGCVLFYTLNSPCTGVCARIGGEYNILDRLTDVFNRINNKALVYNDVYIGDLNRKPDTVWDAWKEINARIPFYRCFSRNCYRCFINNNPNNPCYYN